ncbi:MULTISPECIES: hypothetical protein [Streptomyces]|uniref:hypothetical protein n=1 Tax=Streptomyces TaxID=1883 RepID=UPI00292EFDAF|nr:hypothetical protein [Streptomyces sp. NEAU-HV9]
MSWRPRSLRFEHPAQMPPREEIHTNLLDRLQEAGEQGRLCEIAAIEASLAAAE